MNCENFVVSLESENSNEKKNNIVSLLQGDDIFSCKLLTRDSSKGFSSRIYYRSTEGVPFKWELQPGTPINPTTHESLPPLRPPPAAQISSMYASPPCLTECNRTKGLSWSRVMFWKKSKRSNRSKKQMAHSSPDLANFDRVENLEFWSSDCESVLSDYRSRSSSSSSSSFNCSSPPSPKMLTPNTSLNSPRSSIGVSHGFICTPWNFRGFVGSSPRGV